MTAIAFSTHASAGFDVVAIPAFRDNYIWLLRRGDCAVVVDPGDAAPVSAVLEREGLRLVAILITHHHADHQGGVVELVARGAGRPVAVYGPGAESITGLTHPLIGDECISLPEIDATFTVLAVPGHTAGHLAYVSGRKLFCGDTLFGAGCGRLFEGTPAQMYASLGAIAALPEGTEVYCAHEYTEMNLHFAQAVEPGNQDVRDRVAATAILRGEGKSSVPSTLALERATNPFLRCCEPAVVAAAAARGCPATDPVSVFAAIRAWRNEF